ncbi:MAG: TIR domain-containing protein [Pyrinomonadaceae bacterium]
MKVFLSYAVGRLDAPIAARLRAVAAAYDISILLPDRTQAAHGSINTDVRNQIKQSDAVIALLTRTAQVAAVNLVNLELQAAARAGKPVIALIEQGVPVQNIPANQIVQFDRAKPTAHEASLLNVLNQIRSKKRKDDLTALGWIAGIALGLVALSELAGEE